MDKAEDLVTQVGEGRGVRLTGISDGNIAVEQPLTFKVDSSNASVLPGADVRVTHAAGSPYATLAFQPKSGGRNDAHGDAQRRRPRQQRYEDVLPGAGGVLVEQPAHG